MRKSFVGAAVPTFLSGASMTTGAPGVNGIFLLTDATGWTFYTTARGLRLDGASGSYVTTPDSAALSITSDIDLRAMVSFDDWTPTGDSFVIAKEQVGLRSYCLGVDTTGALIARFSLDGTNALEYLSTVVPPFTNNVPYGIRYTRVSASGLITFYTSGDGINWTQLGTVVTGTAGSIHDNASVVELGSRAGGGSDRLAGILYWVEIRNAVTGAVVASPRFQAGSTSTIAATTTTDAQSNVWTLNGNATYVTDPFVVVVDRGNAAEEKILCGGIGGPSGVRVLVSQRGYDATTAAAHTSGSASILHALDSVTVEEANEVAEYGNALYWMTASP